MKPLPPDHIYCEQRDECDLPERYFCTFHEITVRKQQDNESWELYFGNEEGDAR